MRGITFLTPVYNCEDTILETIKSLESQVNQNWSSILVDDCSTDNTVHVIQNYLKTSQHKDKFMLIQSPKNEDQLNALLKARDFIDYNYVYVLHADDFLLRPESVSMMMNAINKYPDYDAIIAPIQHVDAYGNRLGAQIPRKYHNSKASILIQMLIYGRNQYIDVALVKADVFKKAVSYNYLTWNMPFWLDTQNDTLKLLNVINVDQVFSCYRIHSSNYINNTLGLYTVLSGELRSFILVNAHYTIPFFKLQRFIYRAFNKLNLTFTPVGFKKESTHVNVHLVEKVIASRLDYSDENPFFRSIIAFYKTNRNHTVDVTLDESLVIYRGADARAFFRDLEHENLDSFYVDFMKSMTHGFSTIRCPQTDVDNVKDVLKFFCIDNKVNVEVLA